MARKKKSLSAGPATDLIRLNKYIAQAGVCSRREADDLIQAGKIKVNGNVVTQVGTKVKASDTVLFNNKKLNPEKKAYVLLNKPRDFITTTDDPRGRKTVMALVEKACEERIVPVGRLDRNTTGLLLFTNDGDLQEKLSHPSHRVKKIYHVYLDKGITQADFNKIAAGVELEEGIASLDNLALLSKDGKELGLEIHIGWNRVVRRIFESLGYQVEKLDRVMFAGLTKKDLPRGRWRHLKPFEVIKLKHLS